MPQGYSKAIVRPAGAGKVEAKSIIICFNDNGVAGYFSNFKT
ncbi:hypothetical protein SAMN05428988_3259 [Chitinophaga sp. YR573]|nr:hypothetical protein SAMN05428988_3259 [Chitinophaga sp. YR573]